MLILGVAIGAYSMFLVERWVSYKEIEDEIQRLTAENKALKDRLDESQMGYNLRDGINA